MIRVKTTLAALAAALVAAGCTSLPSAQVAGRAAQAQPGTDAEPLYRLGRYLHGQQKFDEALRVYQRVLAIDPGHVDALNAVGVLHSQLKHPDLAEQAFRAALAEEPRSARTHNNLGYHYLSNGRTADALVEFQSALALDARDEKAQVNIAMARHQLATPKVPATQALAAAPATEGVDIAPPDAGSGLRPTVAMERVNANVFELRNGAAIVAQATPAPAVAPMAEPSARSAATVAAPVKVPVEIANGNGRTGLARQVATMLQQPARLTNSKPYGTQKSRIEYVSSAEQAARDLQSRLQVQIPITPVARLERGGVRVLLGKDFPRNPAELAAPPTQQHANAYSPSNHP